MRTALAIAAFAAITATSTVLAFTAYNHIRPQFVVKKTIKACPGNQGLERCLREQLDAQGAAGADITCGTPVQMPGYTEYECKMNTGVAGCYDLTVERSKRDGYPIVQSAGQRSTC